MHVRDMTHSHKWRDLFRCVAWPIHMCDMIPSHLWHDSIMSVTWLNHMCDVTQSYVWHGSFRCVTRRDMTHSDVHGPLVYVIWLVDTRDVNFSHASHDSFIFVTWLLHMCDMTPSHVWHDSFTYVTWCLHMCDMIHPPIDDARELLAEFFWDMTHLHVWYDPCKCVRHDSIIRSIKSIERLDQLDKYKFIQEGALLVGRLFKWEFLEFLESLNRFDRSVSFEKGSRKISALLAENCPVIQPPIVRSPIHRRIRAGHTATHCTTLQHTSIHCNTLQYTAKTL